MPLPEGLAVKVIQCSVCTGTGTAPRRTVQEPPQCRQCRGKGTIAVIVPIEDE